MAPGSNDAHENTKNSPNAVQGKQPFLEMTDDKKQTPRHPRWTRHETLILIEGKKIAEERGRRGRRSSSVFGSEHVEPKWDFVSSHCRENGVNRGSVQCRKRWSNLVSDFKKVRAWESQIKNERESYWMMRSDLRRERKLPGFFDQEVYDVLDGKASSMAEYQLVLVTTSADGDALDGLEAEEEDDVAEDEEAGNGLFSEFEQVAQEGLGKKQGEAKVPKDAKRKEIPSPVPISEVRYEPFHQAYSDHQGEEPHYWRGSEFQEPKRRRPSPTGCSKTEGGDHLFKALETNTNLLKEQLEAQKLNCQQDREQKKEQHDSLITALSKISDALEKIANKL